MALSCNQNNHVEQKGQLMSTLGLGLQEWPSLAENPSHFTTYQKEQKFWTEVFSIINNKRKHVIWYPDGDFHLEKRSKPTNKLQQQKKQKTKQTTTKKETTTTCGKLSRGTYSDKHSCSVSRHRTVYIDRPGFAISA